MKSKFPRRKGQSRLANSLVLSLGLVAGSSFLAASAQAQTTWSGASGTDLLWSTSTNWTAGIPTTTVPAVFTNTAAAAAGTVTNEVSTNFTIPSLTYSETGGSATAHTTQIDNGVTMNLTGAGTSPTLLNVGPPVSGTTTNSYAVITGTGTLSAVSVATNAAFRVGSISGGPFAAGTDATATLDMSGLSTFNLSLGGTGGLLSVGDAPVTNAKGTGFLTLAKANTIAVATVTVGNTSSGTPGTSTNPSILSLGQTNIFGADTINVGIGKSFGTLQFTTGLTGATATITNRAGTGAAALNIGVTTTSTGNSSAGVVDLTGGAATANFGTVQIGFTATGGNNGPATGTLNFGAGSNITAATVILGQVGSSSGSAKSSATINQSGGTATITTLTLGNRTVAPTGGTSGLDAKYNLSGGTLQATTIAAGTLAASTRNIAWSGGTIQNITGADATIGAGVTVVLSGTGARSFNVTDSATRNLTVSGTLSGATGISKDGVGMLTIAAANPAFTGTTTVNTGALTLTASGTLGTGNVTLANLSGVTLTLGNAAAIDDAATLVFGPSSAIVGNGTGTEVLGAITDSVTGVTLNSANSTQSTYTAANLNTLFGVTSFSGAETFAVVAAVPEPSTWVAGMLSIACTGYSIARRRAQQIA